MSRTYRKPPFANVIINNENLVKKILQRRDGSTTILNMIDSGDGRMHGNFKWYFKRQFQKVSRRTNKINLSKEVVDFYNTTIELT